MDFGEALRILKDGKKVARSGWNGKNMYIYLDGQRWNTRHTQIGDTEVYAGLERQAVTNLPHDPTRRRIIRPRNRTRHRRRLPRRWIERARAHDTSTQSVASISVWLANQPG